MRYHMNKEKYNDPTAEKAIAHVMKEYQKKNKQDGDGVGKRPKQRSRGSTQTV